MADPVSAAGPLAGKRILVVEDQYLIAADLKRAVEDAAAIVVGPAASVDAAMKLADGALDGAVLDVNLKGDTSFAIAARLTERAVPYLFLTGKDGWALPDAFRHVPRILKPYKTLAVLSQLERLTARSVVT